METGLRQTRATNPALSAGWEKGLTSYNPCSIRVVSCWRPNRWVDGDPKLCAVGLDLSFATQILFSRSTPAGGLLL